MQIICTSLQTHNHTSTTSLNFYWPDALPDVIRPVSKHWRPYLFWFCQLGGRKGIQPVKTEWWGAGMVMCLRWGADLHVAQLMPLPLTVSTTTTHTTVLWLSGFCPGLPWWAGSKNVKPKPIWFSWKKRQWVAICVNQVWLDIVPGRASRCWMKSTSP